MKGMSMTRDRSKSVKMILEQEHELFENYKKFVCTVAQSKTNDEPHANDNPAGTAIATTSIPLVAGGKLPIQYEQHNFKSEYKDEYTGEVLPTHLVRAAMEEELSYFNAHVWDTKARLSETMV